MINSSVYKNILDNVFEGVYFVDKKRKILYWNKGAERITGYLAKDVTNSFCFDNILNHVDVSGNELCLNGCPLHATIEDKKIRKAFVYLSHKNGHRVPVTIQTIPIEENNKIIGAVEVFRDESKKDSTIVKDMEVLRELSLYDQLTNLPNRRYTNNFLRSRKNEQLLLNIPIGILFIDIDNFKDINDLYGHDVGDEVLEMIAKVFTNTVRSTDLIGRFGGEEFIGVFCGVKQDILNIIAEKIRMLVEKSYILKDNKRISITISIGATMIKKNDTVKDALKRADKLLLTSKKSGKNRITTG
ncbi:MAG: sensor domain-containing diguanylate cyclase [Clostridiales bacterium]|nr:sensor domain-containing diguanylate cyclase [Clostridiales bacterium]